MKFRADVKHLIFMGVIGFVIGMAIYTSTMSSGSDFGMALFYAFLFIGVPYGWQLSGRIMGERIVIGSLPIMILSFVFRLFIAILTGWIAYPIALIRALRQK